MNVINSRQDSSPDFSDFLSRRFLSQGNGAQPTTPLVAMAEKIAALESELAGYKKMKDDVVKQLIEIRENNHDMKNYMTPLKIFLQMVSKEITDTKLLKFIESLRYDTLPKIEEVYLSVDNNAAELGQTSKVYTRVLNLSEELTRFLEHIAIQNPGITIASDIHYTGFIRTSTRIFFDKVLKNCIINSVQAIREKHIANGNVIVELHDVTSYRNRYNDKVCFDQFEESDIMIVCRDNAGGLPQQLEYRFFDMGFTYNKPSGTGVGTASVRTSVEEKLFGKIALENKEGAGLAIHMKFSGSLEDKSAS